MWKIFKHNLWQLTVCFDQFVWCFICLCCFIHGWADCTLSARAQVWHNNGSRSWPKYLINALFYIFERDHCAKSLENEINQQQQPPEMRS